MTIATG